MTVLCALLVITISIFIFYMYSLSKWKYDYWKKRKVPHLKPLPLFGNYKDYITLKKYNGHVVQEICQQFPEEPYIGAYYGTEPALIVQDLELIKLITAKDFAYFNGREVSKYTDCEKFTRNMFFTYGDKWKVIRQNSSPLFTAAKIKNMFPLITQCAKSFNRLLDREIGTGGEADARALMLRYNMDCICTCGFGIEANTMADDIQNNPFKKTGDAIFENSNLRAWSIITRAIYPRAFYGLGFKVFPDSITNFFHEVLSGVFQQRNYKPINRNDFVDLVLSLQKQERLTCESMAPANRGELVSLKVDDEFLEVQCSLFFAAGFETSSTTMGVTLFELAKNQDAQRRLLEELENYLKKRGGVIDWDCMTELPFMEASVNEAMRLYPTFGVLTREVMADYVLPDGLLLEPGLRIHLPVYHLHRHPRYFPDPDTFKPERFMPENKSNIVPYTYMPFGEGQRICIGMRFAKMQVLVGLATLLSRYRVELGEGVSKDLQLEPRAIVTQSKHGINLRFIPNHVSE